MSLDRRIRLEPFIKIPIQYEEFENEIRSCGEHQDYHHNKFCPKCGKEITIIKTKGIEILRIFELIDNENLCDYFEDDYMYLYSNSTVKPIDMDENVYSKITPELIKNTILKFTKKHEEDIELLENVINQKVCVEFGFLNHVY